MPFWIIIGVCLSVFVMLVAVAGAFGQLGNGMPRAVQSTPEARLPEDFDAEDAKALRFARELRGYRMSQVDEAIDKLSERIATQQATIAELRGRDAATPGAEDAGRE